MEKKEEESLLSLLLNFSTDKMENQQAATASTSATAATSAATTAAAKATEAKDEKRNLFNGKFTMRLLTQVGLRGNHTPVDVATRQHQRSQWNGMHQGSFSGVGWLVGW